ncbi:MAG: GNAT family N-acetyltransferase [Candidatus Heimdallarchaeota archaeon]
MITIRKFQQEDAETVSDLIRTVLTEVNSKDYSSSVIQILCNDYSPSYLLTVSEKRDVFVAVDRDKILGTASIGEKIIMDVFVLPKKQGQKIGTMLMNHAEGLARERGYPHVELPSSTTAREFYLKLGYRQTRDDFDETYGRTILMKKTLRGRT